MQKAVNALEAAGAIMVPDAPTTVLVGPHQAATFLMHWEVIPVNDEPTCPTSASILVTPPDEKDSLKVTWKNGAVPVSGNASSVRLGVFSSGTGA